MHTALLNLLSLAAPVRRTIRVDGAERVFWAQTPSAAPPARGWPVVLSFHGWCMTATQQADDDGLRKLGASTAIVVHPEGYYDPTDCQQYDCSEWQSFNGGGSAGVDVRGTQQGSALEPVVDCLEDAVLGGERLQIDHLYYRRGSKAQVGQPCPGIHMMIAAEGDWQCFPQYSPLSFPRGFRAPCLCWPPPPMPSIPPLPPAPPPPPARTPTPAPSEHPSEDGAGFDAVRLRRLRAFLKETDVEARLCGCVEDLLRVDELPWNPYPSLARLLRKEETRLMLWARPAEAAKQLHGAWREAGLQASSLDPHLSKLNSHCVAWRSLAPTSQRPRSRQRSVQRRGASPWPRRLGTASIYTTCRSTPRRGQ